MSSFVISVAPEQNRLLWPLITKKTSLNLHELQRKHYYVHLKLYIFWMFASIYSTIKGLDCVANYKHLKVPYYTVFHQFDSDVRGPTALYSICIAPEFQLSKSRSTELYSEHSVSVPLPLNANELCLSTPIWRALPATSLSGRRFLLR